MKKFR